MTFEYFQELANDYEELFETDEEYNVIMYVGENEDMEEIHAHSNILRTRSQYFRAAFDLTNLLGSDILNILIAMDELNVQTLILCIQEYLIKHQYEFLQRNSVEILEKIYHHKSFMDIWNFYLEKI